jgi:hypothetical protein
VNALPAVTGSGPVIEHADALDWLAAREPGTATAVIYDPPYAVGTPVRGREDGAAGSVFGPLSFLSATMSLCARALRPGGIVIVFTDWRRRARSHQHLLPAHWRRGRLLRPGARGWPRRHNG